MSIEIHIDNGHQWTMDELPPRTIALDGAVAGPHLDPVHQRYSFDHHANCLRLITRASCEQVFDALLLGMDPSGMKVLINDIDADTVLSTWLLLNHSRWKDPENRNRVRPLVATIGAADCHGPSYPVERPDLLAHMHEVLLDPVNQARREDFSGGIRTVLDQAIADLESWWISNLRIEPREPIDAILPEIEDHGAWVLARGGLMKPGRRIAHAGSLYERGHDRIVFCLERGDGTFHYTLARRSDLVAGFPLPEFYEALNVREAQARGRDLAPGETWGGGSSIGGGPRRGSVLNPDLVVEIVSRHIEENPD